MGRIPERWKEYKGSGRPVVNVPVFACKTPLAKKYSVKHSDDTEFVEDENKFTPADLVEYIKEIGCEIAVVIDLTNTFRYYNGVEEFSQAYNIQYEKVRCEGQKIPNDIVVGRVANILSDVIYQHGKDSKKVVGLHCTHGVNRTGYIIARYLIEWLGYEPSTAIEAFNDARGYDIEREAYLEDLNKRTPELRFDKWKEERQQIESLHGMRDPMSLWTDFDDSYEECSPDSSVKAEVKENGHHFHPYSRANHNNHSQRGSQAPFSRGKWRKSRNHWSRNDAFYEDDYTLLELKQPLVNNSKDSSE